MQKPFFSKVGVIGGGSWGTTLANHLAKMGIDTCLWVREEEAWRQIQNENVNRLFLPGIELNGKLKSFMSFEEVLEDRELVIMAVPSHVFRDVISLIKPLLPLDIPIVSATKGIENDTLMLMSQVVSSILPEKSIEKYACLSGPSFAEEVSKGYPTAVTIACHDRQYGRQLQTLFSSENFRAYTTGDLIGVQLGGALKNVIAIAAGIADGMGFGHNGRAALITRGLAEITRLGVEMGAKPHTFSGLAGMGDLVLTCTGDMSRNRTVGFKIGQGQRLKDITSHMNMVAEGIKNAKSAFDLAKKMNTEMPIISQVYQIIYEEKDPKMAVKELMTRELKVESEF